MFYDELKRIEDSYQSLFDLKVIYDIQKEKVNLLESEATNNEDFLIIKLRDCNEVSCPIDIYLGINKSRGRYSIFLNGKANVYNYEEFETYAAFEEELKYFLSVPIQVETITDNSDLKIYSDYTIPAKDGKVPFSFREYHNKTWTNFLGLKKTKKLIKNYAPWL